MVPDLDSLTTLLFLAWLVLCSTVTQAERETKPCKSNGHVCTSLMKYPDDSVEDEGPYCACSGCSGDWRDDDWQSLSWPHFERADKTVQYRFCVPNLIPPRFCDPGELAVTMETETKTWAPYVREARCTCPDNVYQLLAWWRHVTHYSDNRTGVWVYEYFCEKAYCEDEDSLCAKTYKDQSKDITLGYHFMCACQKGYKCPDKSDDDTKVMQKDIRGSFIPRYCTPVHRNIRR